VAVYEGAMAVDEVDVGVAINVDESRPVPGCHAYRIGPMDYETPRRTARNVSLGGFKLGARAPRPSDELGLDGLRR
jgi:hypothetical protein